MSDPLKPIPTWTTAQPTVPGWYWTRQVDEPTSLEVVEVFHSELGTWWANGNRLGECAGREWFGPIEVPT